MLKTKKSMAKRKTAPGGPSMTQKKKKKEQEAARAADQPSRHDAASSELEPPCAAASKQEASTQVLKIHISESSGRRIRTASLNALTTTGCPQMCRAELWDHICGIKACRSKCQMLRGHHDQAAGASNKRCSDLEVPCGNGSAIACGAFRASEGHVLSDSDTLPCKNAANSPGPHDGLKERDAPTQAKSNAKHGSCTVLGRTPEAVDAVEIRPARSPTGNKRSWPIAAPRHLPTPQVNDTLRTLGPCTPQGRQQPAADSLRTVLGKRTELNIPLSDTSHCLDPLGSASQPVQDKLQKTCRTTAAPGGQLCSTYAACNATVRRHMSLAGYSWRAAYCRSVLETDPQVADQHCLATDPKETDPQRSSAALPLALRPAKRSSIPPEEHLHLQEASMVAPHERFPIACSSEQKKPGSCAVSVDEIPISKSQTEAIAGLKQLVDGLITKVVEDANCMPTSHVQQTQSPALLPVAVNLCARALTKGQASQDEMPPNAAKSERGCHKSAEAATTTRQGGSRQCCPLTILPTTVATKAKGTSHWQSRKPEPLPQLLSSSPQLRSPDCIKGDAANTGHAWTESSKSSSAASSAGLCNSAIAEESPGCSVRQELLLDQSADHDNRVGMTDRQHQVQPAVPGPKGQSECTGISYRKKYNQFEVYFEPTAYKRRLGLDLAMKAGDACADSEHSKKRYYIGLHKFSLDVPGNKERALGEAKRTLDRVKVKVLERLVTEDILQRELHFPLSDYQADDEKNLRATLSLKEFRNHITNHQSTEVVGNSSNLGVTSTRGVHKRKDRHGQIQAFEARYTKSLKQIKSFGSYATADQAAEAYDLATIFILGTARRINAPLCHYMENGKLHAHVRIPPRVKESVQSYISSMLPLSVDEFEQTLARIQGYFNDISVCPFYDHRSCR